MSRRERRAALLRSRRRVAERRLGHRIIALAGSTDDVIVRRVELAIANRERNRA